MTSSSRPSYSYADAGALIAKAFEAFLPSPRVSVADWAAQHRYLANEGGGYVGRWDHEKAPYLVGPMEALTSHLHLTTALVGPGQCGKNALAENWLAQTIDTDPADMLWYMQTEAAVESYVKSKIDEKLIGLHDRLKAKLGTNRSDNAIKFKRFTGMTIEFLGAVPANLINKSAPRLVADEYDACDQLKGDPKSLLDVRRTTFGRESMLLAMSHADKAGGMKPSQWQNGIMALYADSDRRVWWWECPHCGCWSSPNPTAKHYMPIAYDPDAALDEIAADAHLLCPHNGCIVADGERYSMNLTGRWVGTGQDIDTLTGEVTGALVARETAGFWIVGAMSPFIIGGIGALARARVVAERKFERTGEDADLRTVVVKQWGFPYDSPKQIGRVDANALADRAEPLFVLRTVPEGVRFITAAVDNQGNRFEVLFRGWGFERESWVIAHDVIRDIDGVPVDPATSPGDWDDMIDRVLDATFPLADGSGRVMRVYAMGIDSAGTAGVTDQAYRAWKRQRARRRAISKGTLSGRGLWNLLLLKGASTRGARNLSVVFPDTERKDRKAAALGEIPLGIFNANTFKDILAAQLNRAEPGPGYVHVPYALRSAEAPHAFFEQMVAEERKPNGDWVKTVGRNEVTDLMVMTAVIAHLHAPTRFNWSAPPAWASEWDRNPMVAMPVQLPAAGVAAAKPAATAAPATDIRSMVREMLAQRSAESGATPR